MRKVTIIASRVPTSRSRGPGLERGNTHRCRGAVPWNGTWGNPLLGVIPPFLDRDAPLQLTIYKYNHLQSYLHTKPDTS